MIRITAGEWENTITKMQLGMENLTLTGSTIQGYHQINNGNVIIGHHQYKGDFYFEMDEDMFTKYNTENGEN